MARKLNLGQDKYEKYLAEYKKRSKYAKQVGIRDVEKKLTYTQWQKLYTEMHEKAKRQIERGKRKTVGNINNRLVDEQIKGTSSTDKPLSLDRSLYRAYKKEYEKKQQMMAEKYGKEMQTPLFTYNQWKQQYIAMHNDLKDDVAAGLRKGVGNVNQELISEQTFEYSLKQSRKIAEAAQKLGLDVKQADIRRGTYDVGSGSAYAAGLSEAYYARKAENGNDAKEAGAYISWYFFGSK